MTKQNKCKRREAACPITWQAAFFLRVNSKDGGKTIVKNNLRNEVKAYIVRQGMTMQQAQDLAEKMDIKVKEGDEVISDEVDKGLIVSQTPEAGQTIKTGSTITVNISKGLGDGSVPDLTGKMKDELSDYLEAAGFKLGAVTTKASDEPEGTVLSQNPKAGSEVEKGTAIDVVVSDGSKAKATVPYLVGKSLSEAQSELDAGASIDKGSSVKLRVSKGPEPTTTTTTTAAPAPTEPELDGPAD